MWTRSCDFSKKRWKLREGVQSPTFDDNASKQMNTINATDTSWRIFKRGRKRDILYYLWLSPQNVHLVKHEIYQLETGLSHFNFTVVFVWLIVYFRHIQLMGVLSDDTSTFLMNGALVHPLEINAYKTRSSPGLPNHNSFSACLFSKV